MQTSAQWWNETRDNPEALAHWLTRQYIGEVTAAQRIKDFMGKHCSNVLHQYVLKGIAQEEAIHAHWVKMLMMMRSISIPTASEIDAENRYWHHTLPAIEDFHSGCAVGAHAEKMRLERIMVIAQDTPKAHTRDIIETFKKILVDELRHEEAFRLMAGDSAMAATAACHANGMNALGLEA